MFKRKPDEVVNYGYLDRWWVIPRNRWFNIYLHKFTGSDQDRDLHDHPWWSVSFLLTGHLEEVLLNGSYGVIDHWWPVFRRAKHAHRLILCSDVAWTLFFTGPRKRKWGFYTKDGWIPWYTYLEDVL